MVNLASSFSVVSLGISCYKLENAEKSSEPAGKTVVNFANQTFNILTVCSREFTVEPDSIRFLIKHGLDLNTRFTDGIEYYKGNDQVRFSSKS